MVLAFAGDSTMTRRVLLERATVLQSTQAVGLQAHGRDQLLNVTRRLITQLRRWRFSQVFLPVRLFISHFSGIRYGKSGVSHHSYPLPIQAATETFRPSPSRSTCIDAEPAGHRANPRLSGMASYRCATLAVILLLSGCGDGVTPEQWASSVCGSLGTWQAKVADLTAKSQLSMTAAKTPPQAR